jgi:hypothetical protein
MSIVSRGRNFCITDWNLTLWTEQSVRAALENPKLRYVVWQFERSPITGREHVQAYVETNVTVGLKGLKALIGSDHVHVENRRGSKMQAVGYCKKEESRIDGPWEFGEKAQQGARNDLKKLQEDLDRGAPMLEISQNHFGLFLKHYKGIEAYRRLRLPQRNWVTELYIYWGTTGTGKSHTADRTARDGERIYRLRRPNQHRGTLWWDGYEGQEVVVIDEFSGWVPWDILLLMADRYPLTVDVKGGSVPFVARRIYITSNVHPRMWYPLISQNEVRWAALHRRVTQCVQFQGSLPNVTLEEHSILDYRQVVYSETSVEETERSRE